MLKGAQTGVVLGRRDAYSERQPEPAENPDMLAVWPEVDATPLRWDNLHVAAFLIDQERIPLRLFAEPPRAGLDSGQ